MRPKASARGGNVLRRARWVAAGIVFCVATLGFLFPALWAEKPIRVLAAWQFAPSGLRGLQGFWLVVFHGAVLYAGAAGISFLVSFLALLLLSAFFGRWYCAFLCPLGFLQDVAAWAGRKRRGYVKSNPILRASALACFIALGVGGALGLTSWLEPWSLAGRFFAYDVQPLARLLLRADSPLLPWGFIAASGLAAALIIGTAAFRGRWFCNSLCPAGSLLGLLNRKAPLRLRIDPGTCSSCGRCSSVCLADCLDGKNRFLDASRCVYCLECVGTCPTGSVRYGRGIREKRRGQDDRISKINRKEKGQDDRISTIDRKKKGQDDGISMIDRREKRQDDRITRINRVEKGQDRAMVTRAGFLGLIGTNLKIAGGAAIGIFLGVGGAAAARRIAGAQDSGDRTPPGAVSPPGSLSTHRFAETCTACGLCVARCPSKILRPSTGQFGLTALFAPRLDYDVSYCQFSCTTCLDLCPSGALVKLSPEEKQRTKIGDATLVRDLCIVIKNGTKCGACAEHCPTGAVRMVKGASGLPEPVFSTSICIGCGACHHACPVKPKKAITVSGLAVHEVAEKPSERLFDPPDPPGSPVPTHDSGLFPF